MPSRKPRMALTLSRALNDALYDLADALQKPAATVASELLEQLVPQLHGLAKYARLAQSGNKAAAQRALVHMVGEGMADMLDGGKRR
jgi:hypothetical protein